HRVGHVHCSPLQFPSVTPRPQPRSTLFPYTTLFRSRLVGRPHRGREKGSRRQELEDRSLGRHPARRDEARLPSLRQRQGARGSRSEEHTSELQSLAYLVCRLLLEKKNPKREASCVGL